MNTNRIDTDDQSEAVGIDSDSSGSPYTPAYETPRRRPASERENAFNELSWLLEGATGLIEEVRHSDLGLTEELWMHAYAARREGLLALRAVLDALIERGSAQANKEAEAAQRRERRGAVDVEF